MSAYLSLLGHETVHFILTASIAGFLFWRFKDWRLVVVAFFVGIFIDLDHWLDHFICFGFNFDLGKFLQVEYASQCQKVYIVFHGWEFIIPFWLGGKRLSKKLKIPGLAWAIIVPYLVHLLVDQFPVPYPRHIFAYSFIFRLLNNFSLESFNGF